MSAPGFWEPVLLLCHFVPAPPFPTARRPVLPMPLCMVSSSCMSVFLAKPTSQMSQCSRGARGKGAGQDLAWPTNGKHQAEWG